jgi:hypothetical protein
MNTEEILSTIDEEIERLKEARCVLAGEAVRGKLGPKPKVGRRTMTAKGRARIAAAQKARWAKAKRT